MNDNKMTTRNLICIGCPLGCPLTVVFDKEAGVVQSVTGNTCPRGDAYARKEVLAPTRIVTTSVMVEGGELRAVSVKTVSDIPKGKIFDCVEALKNVTLTAPVALGQTVLENAAGTGVAFVTTKAVPVR